MRLSGRYASRWQSATSANYLRYEIAVLADRCEQRSMSPCEYRFERNRRSSMLRDGLRPSRRRTAALTYGQRPASQTCCCIGAMQQPICLSTMTCVLLRTAVLPRCRIEALLRRWPACRRIDMLPRCRAAVMPCRKNGAHLSLAVPRRRADIQALSCKA